MADDPTNPPKLDYQPHHVERSIRRNHLKGKLLVVVIVLLPLILYFVISTLYRFAGS